MRRSGLERTEPVEDPEERYVNGHFIGNTARRILYDREWYIIGRREDESIVCVVIKGGERRWVPLCEIPGAILTYFVDRAISFAKNGQ